MQKKERKQRRHLPGWCGSLLDKDPGELPGAQDIYPISSAHIGSGRISWRAPLGPGLLSLSPQHRFPPICPLPHFFGQHREYFQGRSGHQNFPRPMLFVKQETEILDVLPLGDDASR